MRALSSAATVAVVDEVADAMYRFVSRLPVLGDKELSAMNLQRQLHADVRNASPSGFDVLAEDIRARLAVPYVAYVTGLRFDAHNLLFVALSSVLGDVVDPYNRRSQLVRRLCPARDRFKIRRHRSPDTVAPYHLAVRSCGLRSKG